MVIILKTEDDAEAILDKISQFLAERGMKVSEKKTKLTATTDGFDFQRMALQGAFISESLDVFLQWTTSRLFDRR